VRTAFTGATPIYENVTLLLGVDTIRRWFDPDPGFTRQDWDIEPIATLEFAVASSWLDGARNADLFCRPRWTFGWPSKLRRPIYRVQHIARLVPQGRFQVGGSFGKRRNGNG